MPPNIIKCSLYSPEEINWAKQKEIQSCTFVGKDTLAIAFSSSVCFVNLNDGKETFYHAMSIDKGYGVACVASHMFYKIFAFAEFTLQPRIMLFSYPEYNQINIFQNMETRRYIFLEFSETEHLVALTGIPEYMIEIWNWRTGKLLVQQETGILSDFQHLRCSRSSPLTIIHMATNQQKLNVWEIYGTQEKANLVKRNIKIPCSQLERPFFFTFAVDGSFYLINSIATVWNINPVSNKNNRIIEWTGEKGSFRTFIASYRGGLLICGPNGGIKFFKKNPTTWQEQWTINQTEQLKMINCFQQECFIGCTFNGKIIKLIDDSDLPDQRHFKTVKDYRPFVRYFTVIKPLGEHIAVINVHSELSIVEMATANYISTISCENVCYMKCYTSVPIIVLGTKCGWLRFLSAIHPDRPKWIGELHLSNYEISSCQFSQDGKILIVFDLYNDWFLLKTGLDEPISILHHETFNYIPKNLSVYFQNDSSILITLTVLPVIATRMKICTDLGVEINVSIGDSSLAKNVEFLLPKEYYSLCRLKENDATEFLAIPADDTYNNQMQVMEILKISTADDSNVVMPIILRTIKTMHESSYFMARIYKDFILSWGIDGRIILWDKTLTQVIHSYVAHNRYKGGIGYAVADYYRRHIVTIGHGDNIVCTKLIKNAYDRDAFDLIARAIKRLDINITPPKNTSDISYVEQKSQEQLNIERAKFQHERDAILIAFKQLQEKLKILIDKNEMAPAEEQLPIEAFNLDQTGTEIRRELAQKERQKEVQVTQEWCNEENNSTDWIVEHTWNKMNVKGTSLRGIFTKLKVDNYPLLNNKGNVDDELKRIMRMRSNEYKLSKNDVFQPWKPIDSNDLEIKLAQIAQYSESSDKMSMDSYQTSTADQLLVSGGKYAFSGTSSHLYIVPLPMRYNQMEVVTYHQMLAETTMAFHDTLSLRRYFNGIFDKMMETKHIEMNLVQQRHNRLRYIQDELNILEKLKHTGICHRDDLIDPTYEPDEQPETIVKVEDHEVSITPYISPSRQQLLDEQFAMAEARRLAMLADDFRERALIKMMDGVLEIRWEDEIKKSPPKPECILLDKDPKDYTEEDLLALKQYEDELRQLGVAREKYRQMLVEEKDKIYRNLGDQIQKFNYKVGETLLQKIRVEFAIGSEELKLLGNVLFNFQRKEMAQREGNIQSDISSIKKEIDSLTKIFSSLEDIVLSYRTKYEELSAKDRLLEKQFKSNFSEYAPQAIVDQAYRIFRRRPKWQMRASHTATILQDMGKRINSAVSGRSPLPEECFKYLDLLETAEKFTQAPNLMDQQMWAVLCRMRRVKIEVEFRVRSCGAQLAEAESTLNAFNKEINSKRTKLAQLEKSLIDIRDDQKLHKINRSVQICMKRGNVEIPLTGKLTDFDDTILLHASDVQSINQIIKKAGEKKLKAMEKAALFRRKIIHKEWEHKVLKLKIEEKKNFIKLIEKCKITKEVQLWLQWKQINWPVELTDTMLERKNKAVTNLLEKQCREIQTKINVTNHQIALKRNENVGLDNQIQQLNLIIAEQTAMRNIERETYDAAEHKKRLNEIVERSRLVRKVQQKHCKLLELTTLLELLKLRTYPTLPEKK